MAKKKARTFSKTELSLLLYLEARAVDYGGRLHPSQMNGEDRGVQERWAREGFIQCGRVVMADHNGDGTEWVWLSPEAFKAAQAERRDRAARMWSARTFETTLEKGGAEPPKYE